MYNGNVEPCLNFLCEFQKIYHSSFLWTARLYSHTEVLSQNMVNNGISVIYGTICHYIEYLMQLELPLLFSAFRMSGLAPSQVKTQSVAFKNNFNLYYRFVLIGLSNVFGTTSTGLTLLLIFVFVFYMGLIIKFIIVYQYLSTLAQRLLSIITKETCNSFLKCVFLYIQIWNLFNFNLYLRRNKLKISKSKTILTI